MPNVGYATIQIIPSVRGIGDELRRQLVGPAGDAGQDAGQAAGGGLSDKIKLGAAAAGAAAGALLIAGIVKAVDQANITSTLQAQLGTSNKVAAEQGKIAGKLYGKGIGETFQDAADAIKATVQAGLAPPGTTNKQLESIAAKASNVAKVFDQDLGGVTNAVSQMMRTGLAKNATEAFDLITKGFQSGANKADDLLDTVNEYGTQFRKAGLTGADAIGLINQAIKGGARDADIAADAIKEFSIRAVDGSTSSAQGFNDLGLSGKKMAAGFAKGGAAANSVLDITLDRLRGIKDPVKQSRIAVALFGTQAEDLGKALFAMDPSAAAKGLGQIGGAAQKVGDTIHSGPSHEIEVFKRALEQGFVDFIGGQVLPSVSRLAAGFNTYLLPPIRLVAAAVAGVLLPALSGLAAAGMATTSWLREWGVVLAPVAILIGGITLALNAQAIATAAVTAVFSVYRAAILVGTAVTNGFAAAQALLNAVMALNPITLIVIALVALGAALVVAWQKSETFRNIVLGAWSAIKAGAMWLWTNGIKPLVDGFMVGMRTLGQWATWLWKTVLSPVFSAIATGVKILATIFAIVMFGPLYIGFKVLGVIAMWLWKAVLSPVFGWIVGGFRVLWAGVKLYVSLWMAIFRAVGAVAAWLWKNAISPVVGWIVGGFRLLWAGVKAYFNLWMAGFRAVGAAATWLWKNAVSPALSAIGAVISNVYNSGIKPVFSALKAAVGQVGKAFSAAKDAVKIAWDKLKAITRAPIEFVVNTVYNKGIVGVWNKVAGAFGAPKLSTYKFASGGVLPGYTPGRDVHRFFSPTGGGLELSGGEAIMRPEFTRAVGSDFIGYFNRLAKTRGASGVKAALAPTFGGNPRTPTQRFADGGIFGWIGKKAAGVGSAAWEGIKKGASWLKDGLEASARAGVKAVVDPLLRSFPGAETGFGRMVRSIPTRLLDAIFGYSKTADKKGGAGGLGGPRVRAALSWARGQAGKAYQWAGNGNPSWDCSGFLSAIESVLRGEKPHRRWSTFAFQGGTAPAGWKQSAVSPFRIGITNAGVGHTAGTLGGVNVESRGGDGVVVGKRARGYNSSLFTHRYGFLPAQKFDAGGWLQPGVTAAVNATRQPEAILTAKQWKVAQSALVGGERLGDVSVQVFVGNEEISRLARVEVRRANGELVSTLRAGRKG